MMKAVPQPRARFELALRSVMSAGEAVGSTVFAWAQDALGVTINEMFGQTEMNYIVGNSHTLWPAKPGSMGRPYPGTSHRRARRRRRGGRRRRNRRGRGPSHRLRRHARSGVFPRVLQESRRHGEEIQRRLVPHRRSRAPGRRTAISGTRVAADDMFKAAGYRIGPSEIENCLVKHAAVANAAVVPSPDETRGNIVKAFIVLAPGRSAVARAGRGHPAPRARVPGALRVPEGNRVHRCPADDHDRQGAAARPARARAGAQGAGGRPPDGAPAFADPSARADRDLSSRGCRARADVGDRIGLVVDHAHADELSVVCAESLVPAGGQREPRLARAALRRAPAARSDRHSRERHRAAGGRAHLGVRASRPSIPTTCSFPTPSGRRRSRPWSRPATGSASPGY